MFFLFCLIKDKMIKLIKVFIVNFTDYHLSNQLMRHRWFLTVSDIERFFKNYSIKNKFTYEIVSPLNKSFKSKLLGFFKRQIKKGTTY